jgi:deoxyribonuclease V
VKAEIFDGFKSKKVLKKMREKQEQMSREIELNDSDFELVAGFDISYYERFAKGALCLMNLNMEILEVRTGYELSCMPYIPTYLGFRELPLFQKLSEGLRDTLYIIDGNGIMHPRLCGSACMMGLHANAPSIGVAKSKLLGDVKDDIVFYEKRQIGWKEGRVFISPGNKIGMQRALELVKKFSKHGVPEQLRIAHMRARIEKQKND